MEIETALQAEAYAWKHGIRRGPVDRSFFVLVRDLTGWTLLVRPLHGQQQIATGLTFPEANRRRLALSDAGYIGKVVS